nr:DUF421 domain-containing protein [Bacillus kwashiorkori]
MGKREIGELSILDLVVFVMIAEMAVMAIERNKIPFFENIFPMLILMFIQILLSFISLKSRAFRRLVDGEPSIIIKNGKILEKEMKKQRYNFDDLLMQLREKDISKISDVEFAILESSGKLSVIKKQQGKKQHDGFTAALILDGEVQEDKLKEINKTPAWLNKELAKRGYHDVGEISFCSYSGGEFYIDVKD